MNQFDADSLRQRKPYLQALLSQSTDSSNQFHFKKAKNGQRYIFNKKPLSSKYAPDEEADRLIIASELTKSKLGRVIIIFGLANPIVLEKLIELRTKNQICIAIDHRTNLLQFLIQNDAAVQKYLSTANCHLFGPLMLDSLWSYIAGLPIEGFRGLSVIRHPSSVADAENFYSQVEAQLQTLFKSGLSDLLTRFEFEPVWLRNTLLNLRYIPERQSGPSEVLLSYYKSRYKDCPAILVGAGPSLRKSLPLLKSLSRHCLIVAASTALKPLLKSGIHPHIVHLLDAQPHTLLHLRGEDLSKTVIFADLVTNPKLTEQLPQARFVFSTTSKYYYDASGQPIQLHTSGAKLAQNQAGSIGSLQSGGSVTTSAFDLLRFLEASPIFLIGMDLAWTHHQLHCVGTHHYEKWTVIQNRLQSYENINETLIRKRVSEPVASLIEGKTTMGDHVLNLYRSWFEESIKNLPGLPVWNLTVDGALIHGAYRPQSLNVESISNHFSIIGSTQCYSKAQKIVEQAPHLLKQKSHLLTEFMNSTLQLIEALNKPDFDAANQIQDFFALYPDAIALRKKADSYIKRNSDTLTDERRKIVLQKYLKRELERLSRWFEYRV